MKKVLSLFVMLCAISSFAFAEPASSMEISIRGEAFRGQPLVVSIATAENAEYFKINWRGIAIEVPAQYSSEREGAFAEVMLPALYKQAGTFSLDVTAILANGQRKQSLKVKVNDKAYPRETLTVDQKYVSPGKAALERIAKETPQSRTALRTFSDTKLWTLPLLKPRNEISGVYGEQRVFNGVPKNPHTGTDFRGSTGDDIVSVADGKVVLTGDFYYNGQFVFVDHGQGVITAYLHMSEILVKKGDDVTRGGLLGKVGATGRVTGPHLHFALYVQGLAMDSEPLFE